jgi:hypothetical protein
MKAWWEAPEAKECNTICVTMGISYHPPDGLITRAFEIDTHGGGPRTRISRLAKAYDLLAFRGVV